MTALEAAARLSRSRTLQQLAEIFATCEVFLVGGALRDRLLGLPTHDFDLATRDDPQKVASTLSRRLGGNCFPLGHPPLVSWRVVARLGSFDIWGIPGSVEQDILRRDFTVNALFWQLPRGPLLDPTGGLDDLAYGRICVISKLNLVDDPLRVLRGVRLVSTRPMLRLTRESERALADAAALLPSVAAERIIDELRQLLAGPAVARALATAARLGIMAVLFPEWRRPGRITPLDEIAASLARRINARGALAAGAKIAALAVLAAPAAGFPNRWQASQAAAALVHAGFPPRLANEISGSAAWGEKLFRALLALDVKAAHALAAEIPLPSLPPALAWAMARGEVAGKPIAESARALLAWAHRFSVRPPLLDGDTIAKLAQLPPGPDRAQAVRALRQARVRGEVRTRGQAEGFVKNLFPR